MEASLLSPGFLALAAASIVLLTTLSGVARQLAFAAVNLTFIGAILRTPVGVVSTVLFTLLGYGLAILSVRRGRRGLVGGLVVYVALFVYMRRYDFLTWFVPDDVLTSVLATAGLSFLLFKIVHVMIDAYSGTLGRLEFVTYVNYCLNFTTFMMGPIQRYQDFASQWSGKKQAIPLEFEAHLDAVLRILLGFVKVYILALYLRDLALSPDTDLLQLSLPGLVVQTYAFWFYLYLNFSGYCDIVIGIGSLFGVRPPENFNKPFLARNISDFWLRQHRSLTLWLTDYVFSPLYKKALTTPRMAKLKFLAINLCLMTTMMVSGLWHGTTISFFIFGLVHGLWFVVYRTWDELLIRRLGKKGTREFRARPLVHLGGIFLTFNATAFAFIFFQVSPERVLETLTAIVSI